MIKPNPLFVIMAILAISFAGRVIGLANASIKENSEEKTLVAPLANEAIAPIQAPTDMTNEQPKDEPQKSEKINLADKEIFSDNPVSSAEKANRNASLLEAIRERSAQLDTRADAVEDRIRQLEIIETRINEKLSELKSSNKELSALVSFANEASQEDILLLSKMYEQMKPQKAAEIFDKMNPTFAAGFLTEMNSENAALILSNMSTDKAYETSMIIASRNAAVYQ